MKAALEQSKVNKTPERLFLVIACRHWRFPPLTIFCCEELERERGWGEGGIRREKWEGGVKIVHMLISDAYHGQGSRNKGLCASPWHLPSSSQKPRL